MLGRIAIPTIVYGKHVPRRTHDTHQIEVCAHAHFIHISGAARDVKHTAHTNSIYIWNAMQIQRRVRVNHSTHKNHIYYIYTRVYVQHITRRLIPFGVLQMRHSQEGVHFCRAERWMDKRCDDTSRGDRRKHITWEDVYIDLIYYTIYYAKAHGWKDVLNVCPYKATSSDATRYNQVYIIWNTPAIRERRFLLSLGSDMALTASLGFDDFNSQSCSTLTHYMGEWLRMWKIYLGAHFNCSSLFPGFCDNIMQRYSYLYMI